MATSKTLTPTNETIQIPAMTDAPDASVFSNCIDKEADAINALNSKLATSYYDMTNIGVIRFVGKIAILDFINTSGQIPSTGLQLPYTFVDDIRTICQYYNGSANDIGELHINKNGSVYVRKSGAYVNATYVLGQAVAYLAT